MLTLLPLRKFHVLCPNLSGTSMPCTLVQYTPMLSMISLFTHAVLADTMHLCIDDFKPAKKPTAAIGP